MSVTKFLWRFVVASCVLPVGWVAAGELTVVPLWVGGAPGSEAYRDEAERPVAGHEAEGWVENIHNPSLTVYLPPAEKATGAAIVVAPGGGHRMLAVQHEGHQVGEWLADHGIAAFVLKYRLYRPAETSPYKRADAIADGERAMRLVRSRAKEWNVNPDRIGFLGFSAGGDLTLAVVGASDDGDAAAADPIDRVSSRANFQVPIYPGGLDGNPPQVTSDTPPTLLICAADDRDSISNALPPLYLNLKKAKVPIEMHIYGSGGHGFGIRPGEAAVHHWPERLTDWLHDIGMTKP
jgi:acetyl esterase/lipase